jgi:nicotinate-nucleotide--dimethylbenzimidazole phosphoribosyltransferase
MLGVFESGGAAISVLARVAGAEVVVVDAGVGAGTANATLGPAMSRERALESVNAGIELARGLDCSVVALGDMGIANTTAASALHAALLDVPAASVCGPGTGLDAAGVRHKVDVVERALRANAPLGDDPVEVLAALGGFEIAFLAGVALGAAEQRLAIVLDGFIVAAAALVAARIEPRVRDYMIAAHLSPEPGHRLGLDALGLQPLLELGLRLGEGSGAALALPLVRASLAVLHEMATFDSAGVTDAGR